jgi:ABC-2 type transport system permease protein
MTRFVHAELRSLRDTKSILFLVIGAVAIAALAALFATAHELTDLLQAETVVMTLFTLLAGAVAGAGEFQHSTVVWTLLAAPNRPVAAAAKVAAVAILGAVVAAAVLGVTWVVGALKEGGLPAGTGIGELIVGQLALGMLTGIFGLAVGLGLRNLPAAVGAVFTLALLVPLVFEAKPQLGEEARFLPYGELSAAALALGSAPATSGPQLAVAVGGLVLLGWTALVAAAAVTRFVRQDVS